MYRIAVRIAAAACLATPALLVAQVQNNGPKAATYITDEDVKAVNALPGIDRQIVSVDIGKSNMQVGIVHRAAAPAGGARAGGAGAGAGRGAGAGAGGGAGRGAAPAGEACGQQVTPAPSDATGGGIAHDGQTE